MASPSARASLADRIEELLAPGGPLPIVAAGDPGAVPAGRRGAPAASRRRCRGHEAAFARSRGG
ncbi:hypothetical protein ACWCQR_51750, partial [Streptomyces sp. NPDC002172]